MPTSAQAPASTYQIPPGRLGNLTPEQQKVLDHFRESLQAMEVFVPERHNDATLLRFLRARKFDLPRAIEMMVAAEKWRKEYGVDEIVK